MPSNNRKYSQEMHEQTAKHIIESRKSATRMAETKGIQPSSPQSEKDLLLRNRELERALKQKEKQLKRSGKNRAIA